MMLNIFFISLLVTCVPFWRKSMQIFAQCLDLLSVVQFSYSDTSPVWLECFVGWGYSLWSSQLCLFSCWTSALWATGVSVDRDPSILSLPYLVQVLCPQCGVFVEERRPSTFCCTCLKFSITPMWEQCEMLVTCTPREMPVVLIWSRNRSHPLLEARSKGREQVMTQVPQILLLLRCTQYSQQMFIHLLNALIAFKKFNLLILIGG